MTRTSDPWVDLEHTKSARKYSSSGINSRKNNLAYKKRGNEYSNAKNRNHVVVKIIGGAKNLFSVDRNMTYDSREDTLTIKDREGNEVPLEDSIKMASREFQLAKANTGYDIPDARYTYRLAFSMNGKVDPDIQMAAVRKTLCGHLPNNNFWYNCHEDTKNNHVHVTISKFSGVGKSNLHLDKPLLNKIKATYAKELQKRGVEAVFNSYSDKLSEQQKMERAEKRKQARDLASSWKVIEYGEAPYRFQEGGSNSFYLTRENMKGQKNTIWSQGLKNAVAAADVKPGDTIKLKETQKAIPKVSPAIWDIKKTDPGKTYQEFNGRILAMSEENFEFKKNAKKSFYVSVEDDQGEKRIFWDKSFKKAFEENGIHKGDKLHFIIGKGESGAEHINFRRVEVVNAQKQAQTNKIASSVKLRRTPRI